MLLRRETLVRRAGQPVIELFSLTDVIRNIVHRSKVLNGLLGGQAQAFRVSSGA